MKLEDIHDAWGQDAVIDKTQLDTEAGRIPLLHHKYLKILSTERLLLRKYEKEYKRVKLETYEVLTQGPAKEQVARYDWAKQLPAKGRIGGKQEVDVYMDGNETLTTEGLKVALQREKVDVLVDIIQQINQRNFQLNVMMKYMQFTQGAG